MESEVDTMPFCVNILPCPQDEYGIDGHLAVPCLEYESIIPYLYEKSIENLIFLKIFVKIYYMLALYS